MSQNTVKPEQIKAGALVAIKFDDLDHEVFGMVLNLDHKARKKFVEKGKGGFTVSVVFQERDGSFADMIEALTTVNFDMITKVSEPINFRTLMKHRTLN